MIWSRPTTVPRGQVWLRFKGRDVDGQPARSYQIRDLEDEYKKECIELLSATFVRDEPLCKLFDFKSDPASLEAAVSDWWLWLDQNISLACFTEVNGRPIELVAVNVLYVKTKDDVGEDVKGIAYNKVIRTLTTAEKLVDVFSYFNVDKYLTSSGVTVLPGHRGQNIAARLFEARYQIRDLEDEYKKECIELMSATFVRDEPLCKLFDFKSDPASLEAAVSDWWLWLDQNISLACFTEVNDRPIELVAVNVLYVKTKDDVGEDVKGIAYNKVIRTLTTAEKLVDVFSYFNVDKYLTSSGVTVLPGHRGQNIAARLFEARQPLCKALNIQATCTVFTATASQILASKCGYQLLATLPYKEMSKYGLDLSNCECDKAEVRGTKFY